MGIRIFWDNDERTILRQVFEPEWTVADYHFAMDIANTLMNTVPWVVDVIVDLSNNQETPSRMLHAALSGENLMPTNHGYLIVIKPQEHIQAAFELSKRIMVDTLPKFVNTLEEAYALLESDNLVIA